MRTLFEDWEDKALVQIAFQFEREGIRITWDYVARRFKKKRTAQQLRLRLASLKRTYGRRIVDFPPCFFSSVARGRLLRAVPEVRPQLPVCRTRAAGSSPAYPMTASPDQAAISRSSYLHSMLTPTEASQVMASLFGSISAGDIRQPAGRVHDNAGEILPPGVSTIVGAVGPVGVRDVFLDIGSGIGNVVAQVALMTSARVCVGVELRAELCSLGQACIERYAASLPQLRKVYLKASDVRDAALSSQAPTCEATIIFANIFLFEEDAKLVVARELAVMPNARVIAATSRFLPQTPCFLLGDLLHSLVVSA